MKILNLKNRNSLIALVAIFITSSIFTSCYRKDRDGYGNPPISNPSGTLFSNTKQVNATIHGQIFNEDGTPSVGATVKIGTNATSTDNIGFFMLPNISTSENATLVSVSKGGYYNAFRTISVKANQVQKVKITILKLENAIIFNNATGAVVNAVGGGTVTFGANTLVNKTTNAAYSGNVTAYVKRINPGDANLTDKIPGSLRAIDENNFEKVLTTYGMLGVELLDASGNALQLKQGTTAKISLPLDGAWANNAPTTIPLWHFNENNGMWKQEGEGAKVGANYEGDVSHFSFWNCDVPNNYVQLTATFVDQNANPLVNYYVKITEVSSANLGVAFTDGSGFVGGAVPNGVALELKVYEYCGTNTTLLYTQTIPASSVNINLGTIPVTITNANIITLTGICYDCNNNALPNAFVKMENGFNYYLTTANNLGVYNFNAIACALPITYNAQAYDNINLVTGSPLAIYATAAGTLTNNLYACGNLVSFFNYSENNNGVITNFNFTEPINNINHMYQQGINTIWANDSMTSATYAVTVQFSGPQTTAGLHTLASLLSSTNSIYEQASNVTGLPVTITNYGPIGGWIEGSFTTPVLTWQSGATNKTASATFRVKRNN